MNPKAIGFKVFWVPGAMNPKAIGFKLFWGHGAMNPKAVGFKVFWGPGAMNRHRRHCCCCCCCNLSPSWVVLWHLGQVHSVQADRLGIYAAQEALAPEVSTNAQKEN